MTALALTPNLVSAIPCQAESDEHLIALWLHGRPASTRRAYAAAVHRFQDFTRRPLPSVRLGDLQAFVGSLDGLADATRGRVVASVKSLLRFGHRVGYLAFDVGAALIGPKQRNRLSERILTEAQVIAMITLEPNQRNRTILRTLYVAGLRVSELVGLCWRDVEARDSGEGQITVYGKGSKVRVVLIPTALRQELEQLRRSNNEADPVFLSRKHAGKLDQSQITRIVRQAASRAGIKKKRKSALVEARARFARA